ncbi:unnamed protein product [Durusdinium trenchii]|uniref:Uncharacterized protein n=1 Tax=Durusdinium trenchii TaxID=1381693 RepID=A0ABP0LHR7_9DINO
MGVLILLTLIGLVSGAHVRPLHDSSLEHLHWKGQVDSLDEYLALTSLTDPMPKAPNLELHRRRMYIEWTLLFTLVPLIPAVTLLVLYMGSARTPSRECDAADDAAEGG